MPRGPAFSILQSFLEDPARPDGTLRYHELQGFLFTVASAPELVHPSEWIPVVFGDHAAGYESLDEAKVILGELMALYNEINDAVSAESVALPKDCRFRRQTLANLDGTAPVAEWSRGFVLGHQWLEELWDPYVPDELEDEFATTLVTLSFFASRKLADTYVTETGQHDVAVMARAIRRVFPDALSSYAHLGRSIYRVLIEREGIASEPRRVVKTNRNDPCPCGSGRKYKKCCGAH